LGVSSLHLGQHSSGVGLGSADFLHVLRAASVEARLQGGRLTLGQSGYAHEDAVRPQMTMDVFGLTKEDFIPEVEVGGAATFLEFAATADVNLFI